MKLRRAPTLVLATALLSGDPHVDEEDLHATACAVYAVLLGATNRGLASYWRTPACFTTSPSARLLGLAADERVVALIHLGPAVSEPPREGAAARSTRCFSSSRSAESAGERSRTSKGRSPPGPKPGASASSATPAWSQDSVTRTPTGTACGG